jgi:hypothetical protein
MQGILRSGIDLRSQLHKVTREQFPLPTLGPVLDGVREEVRAGRGFALIRNFPVERWGMGGLRCAGNMTPWMLQEGVRCLRLGMACRGS